MLRPFRRLPALAGLAVALCVSSAAPAAAQRSTDGFQDPRAQRWVDGMRRGDRAGVLRDLERELASPQPHPYAINLWYQLRVDSDSGPQLPTALQARYAEAIRVRRVADGEQADARARLLEEVTPTTPWLADDPFAAFSLAFLANSRGQILLAAEYAVVGLRTAPFGVAASNLAAFLHDASARDSAATQRLIARERRLLDGPVGVYWRRTQATRSTSVLDWEPAAAEWLNGRPADPYALTQLADAARERGDLVAADSLYVRAIAANPLRWSAVQSLVAVRLTRGLPVAEARRPVTAYAALVNDATTRPRRAAQLWVDATTAAGWRGIARETLDSLRRAGVDTAFIAHRYATLEIGSRRWDAALPWAEAAVRRDTLSAAAAATLIQVLRETGSAAQRRAWLTTLDLRFPAPMPALANSLALLASDLKEHEVAIRIYGRALRLSPGITYLSDNQAWQRAAAGDTADAYTQLRRNVFEGQSFVNAWVIARLKEWGAREPGTAAVHAMLDSLRRRRPTFEALWDEARARETTPARRAALTREAIAANPHVAWSYGLALWDAREANNVRAVDSVARSSRDALRGAGRTVRIAQANETAEVLQQLVERGRDARLAAEVGLAALDTAVAIGASPASVAMRRGTFLRALGDERAASLAEEVAALANPADNAAAFFQRAISVLGPGRAYRPIDLAVRQDPWMNNRVERQLWARQLWWNSDPVGALAIIDDARARGVDVNNTDTYEAWAYGELGDNARFWRARYQRETTVGVSTRYVQWYETARSEAQASAESPDSVVIEPDGITATTYRANGVILRRADHPRSGRPTLRQDGAAWLRAAYDSTGDNLVRIEVSTGRRIELSHDANDLITRMIVLDPPRPREELRFTYNAARKPVRIEVVGLGAMLVTYDARNEIETTRTEGGNDTEVAQRVSQAFEVLTSLTSGLSGRERDPLARFTRDDSTVTALRARVEDLRTGRAIGASGAATDPAALTQARLALARRLVERLADRVEYRNEAGVVLQRLIRDGRRTDASAAEVAAAISAIDLYVTLQRQTRRGLLEAGVWVEWQEEVAWLRSVAAQRQGTAPEAARRTLARVEREPLALAPAARWLPRSTLRNVGLWRRHEGAEIWRRPPGTPVQITAATMTADGATVVGSAQGIAVLRRGFWESFTVGSGESALLPAEPDAASRAVLALASSTDGHLWIGTADGLLRVSPDLRTVTHRWGAESLAGARVDFVRAAGPSAALVGSAAGLTLVRPDGEARVLSRLPVRFLRGFESNPVAATALVGTDSGVFVLKESLDGDSLLFTRITGARARDAAWLGAQAELLLLVGDRIEVTRWSPDDSAAAPAPQPLPGAQDIVRSVSVHGLRGVDIDGAKAVAILTDQGISLYRQAHVEHFDIPDALTDRRAGVRLLASDERSIAAIGDGDVWIWERGQVRYAMQDERVHRAEYVAAWDGTVIRTDRRTILVPNGDSVSAGIRIGGGGMLLFVEPDGSLLFNEGASILRLPRGQSRARLLFRVPDPSTAQAGRTTWGTGLRNGALSGLQRDSTGAIWVSRGGSVFRWTERTQDAEEFSFFVDPERFPSRTHDIAGLQLSASGRLFAIGSSEGHLDFRGTRLSGGLLEFNAATDRFEFRDTPDYNWFFTGMTPVEPGTDIVGTLGGFVLMRGNRAMGLRSMQDPSYTALRQRVPGEYFGTRGTRLADGLFLFGTANGVIGYHDGAWFYPDRLNRLLPDDHLADYGGRHITAIAADSTGRLFVGTVRGLLEYDPRGAEALSFLVAQGGNPTVAFGSLEQRKLRREADVLLDALPADGPAARRARQLTEQRRQLEALRDSLSPALPARGDGAMLGGAVALTAAPPLADTDRERLRSELQRRERAHNAALAQLERDDRGLFQLLQLNPLDLAAEAKQLQPGQVVVQYLPSAGTLFIQVLTRDAAPLIREVRVPRDTLFLRATRAARALATQARRPPSGPNASRGVVTMADTTLWRSDLAWLYEQLLRPVEAQLEGATHVFVVPTGALTYLPFGALRRESGSTGEYAAERYVIASVPTLYLLRLAQREGGFAPLPGVVVGDPDGSLPGARQEAGLVQSTLGTGTEGLIGADATIARVRELGPQSRVLHLATHGVLDAVRPGESYLLLSGGENLTVADAMTLGLTQTDLVVLSACESGLGGDGLEYATIARAFAHAGARSVVATLWAVNDAASAALVRRFYRALRAGDDVATAMTKAQRALLSGLDSDGAFQAPGFWAGYMPFGAPARITGDQ